MITKDVDIQLKGAISSWIHVLFFPIVTLNHIRWCWKSSELTTVVVKGSQSPLKFIHTGYSMKYEVSHDTLIVS